MDVSVEEEEMEDSRSVPTSETSSSEQDRVRQSSKQCSRGKRLMIIELRTYIEVGKLLIEKESAGSQATSNLSGRRPEGIYN